MSSFRSVVYFLCLFFVTYFIYVYPFDVINYFLIKESIFKTTSLISTLFIYLIIIFYFKTKNTFFLFKLIVHQGIGIGFISFWITNISLIFYILFPIHSLYLGLTTIFLIFLLCCFSFIKGNLIYYKKINITSNKVSKNIRLIFLSDIHLGSNSKKHLEKICSKLNSLKFDLLLIGGDLIDSSNFNIDELKILKNIKKPILFVSGNHEYYLKDYKSKLKSLENYNLIFLDNKNFKYSNLNIVGISDNQTLQSQEVIMKKLINKNLFNLILVHRPKLWNYITKNIDLMLSGHTHKGQIFPFSIFVKLQYKNIYGLYEKLNSKLYVSSGCGCWGPKMRLGTNNEIVDILISSQK